MEEEEEKKKEQPKKAPRSQSKRKTSSSYYPSAPSAPPVTVISVLLCVLAPIVGGLGFWFWRVQSITGSPEYKQHLKDLEEKAARERVEKVEAGGKKDKKKTR